MPQDINMGILFKLPPEKAVEYLQSRGYIVTRNWLELLDKSREKAFTITGIMKEDILQEAKNIIDQGVSEGKTFQSIKNEFQSRMQTKGWAVSTYRLKQIYRINGDIAYSVGRYEEQEATKDFAPYWMYEAVMDKNTRPEHAALNGKVFKADDPFWTYFYPPNGYACRCRVRALTPERFERKGLTLETGRNNIKTVKVDVGGVGINTKAYKGIKVDPGWDKNLGKTYLESKKKNGG